jgi:hypothetical protein
MSDVGMLFGVVLPNGVKVRLFVRLIVRLAGIADVLTVIITGDQPVPAVGFAAMHVAPPDAAWVPEPHVYPHIGIAVPSGSVVVVGAAVK